MEKKSNDFQFELKRKSVHIFSLFLIYLYYIKEKTFVLEFLVVCLLIEFVLEFLRLERGVKIPFFHSVAREKEKNVIGAEIYYTLGAIVSISIFRKEIALASIAMTTLGDLTAAIIGTYFGKNKLYKNKSIEGSGAEFVVDLLLCLFFTKSLVLSIIMAFTATVTETLSDKINDNLTIPVCSGAVGEFLFRYI